jgi:hypothetical protein
MQATPRSPDVAFFKKLKTCDFFVLWRTILMKQQLGDTSKFYRLSNMYTFRGKPPTPLIHYPLLYQSTTL